MARLALLIVFCFIGQCSCVQLRLFRNNFRMQNVTIIEPGCSLAECAGRFVNDKASHTFNFYKGDKICELSELYPEEDGLQSAGWNVYSVIYDRKYYPSNKTANWADAQEACTNMSAKLVMIDDESEQARLESIVGPGEKHWIGLSCTRSENPVCTWIDGRQLEGGYTNWYPGEPGTRAAIWMGYGGYMWDDDYWSRQKNFICEFL